MDRTENTARHEAAHAVAAHALGLLVLSVDADPGGFPVTRFRSRVVDNWDRAVVSMAGPIAEGRHPAEGVVSEALADLDWQDEEDHDDDLASALAEYPDLTDDQRVNVVMLAWQRAADLLAEHEPAWQRVTAALVQRHQLDGAGFLALAEGPDRSRGPAVLPSQSASPGLQEARGPGPLRPGPPLSARYFSAHARYEATSLGTLQG